MFIKRIKVINANIASNQEKLQRVNKYDDLNYSNEPNTKNLNTQNTNQTTINPILNKETVDLI